ncbi:hypothetical protein [Methanosarcina sp.]
MPKDEKGREIPSRFLMEEEGLIFKDAAPLTDEDLAELAKMRKMLGID